MHRRTKPACRRSLKTRLRRRSPSRSRKLRRLHPKTNSPNRKLSRLNRNPFNRKLHSRSLHPPCRSLLHHLCLWRSLQHLSNLWKTLHRLLLCQLFPHP